MRHRMFADLLRARLRGILQPDWPTSSCLQLFVLGALLAKDLLCANRALPLLPDCAGLRSYRPLPLAQ